MQFDGITSIIFDFDGTLATCPYDFKRMREALLVTAEEYGMTRAQLAGFGLLETIEEGAALLATDAERAQAFRDVAMQRLEEIEMEAAVKTRLLPGITDALEGLHTLGFRLGIVTRNSTTAVRLILGETILPVRTILCREDVPNPKPHIDHVRRALHHLDDLPVHAMMVGDHPTDIQMGKAAGMATVAVLTGQSSEDDLRAAEPDLLLPNVLALSQILLAARLDSRRNA